MIPARILASGLRLVRVQRDPTDYSTNAYSDLKLVLFEFEGELGPEHRFMGRYGIPRGGLGPGKFTWNIFARVNSSLHKRTFFWERKLLELQQLIS